MHIAVQQADPWQTATPLLVVCSWQAQALPEAVLSLVEFGDFSGKKDESVLLYPRGTLPCRRLLLLGMGEYDLTNADTLRRSAARAMRRARALKVDDFTLLLPMNERVSFTDAAQVTAEGLELGAYRYLEHKSTLKPEEQQRIEHMTLLVEHPITSAEVQASVASGQAIARGVMRARNLANAPGNVLTPTRLGEVAQEIGAQGGIATTVLGLDDLKAQGFGGLLAVGQGSAEPPCFIIMEYGQPGPDRPTICLVGKGITFDTGGVSMKAAANMDDMKMDMGGAAAVLGTMQAVAELGLPLHVVALISAAENMVSGRAYKPGDIITTLSGKTIEVLNTDAEGRIVLADALYYAQRYQPAALIDVATLTGAIIVALGKHAMGLMSNHQPLAERLLRAGEASADRAWQLPLWDAYREEMKSKIADLRNITGTRYAGSITAAAFLENFVGNAAWAHLDIAGVAWVEEPTRDDQVRGATGAGVRLLLQALHDWQAASEQ